ncbi:MAG: oxidoreductase [Zetaproteobacteria bacterium]|nr:oxidoreductase [Zetaproteobacteria bacterium]
MIKVAIAGYGFAAHTFHVPLLHLNPDYRIVALSTSNPDKIPPDLQSARVYRCPQEMLQHPQLDLVLITLPNTLHFELSKQALMAHKHVVVEKPFVNTLAEGEQLIELAERSKLVLSVFHNRRWDGDLLTVQKLIAEKRLGKLKFFESHFDRYRPEVQQRWRERAEPGSGIWFDLGSHLVDQALQLFALPEAVTGRCLQTRPQSQTDDYFHVQLHYPDHEVILHGSCYAQNPRLRFLIQGQQASYTKYGLDPQEQQLRQGDSPTSPHWGREAESEYGHVYAGGSTDRVATLPGSYENFYAQLARVIQGHEKSPAVTAEQALDVIRVLLRAAQSSQERRTLLFSS